MVKCLRTLVLFFVVSLSMSAHGQAVDYFAYWNFNNSAQLTAPVISKTGASLTATLAVDTQSEVVSATGQNFSAGNAMNDDAAGSHLRLNLPIGSVLNFNIPTSGYSQVIVRYETRRSGSGAGTQKISYSIDGTSYLLFSNLAIKDEAPEIVTLDFSAIAAVNDNNNFKVRIEFEKGSGGVEGNNRFDNVTVAGVNSNPPVDPNIDLIFPAAGSGAAVLRPVFRWTGNTAPYTLQLSTSSTFEDIDIDIRNLSRNHYIPSVNLLTNQIYYWRVGVEIDGADTYSAVSSFRTRANAPSAVISYFAFEAANNTDKIQETIVGDILGDTAIIAIVPGGISNFDLIPTFTVTDVDSVVVNGRAQESQWSAADFSSTIDYELYVSGNIIGTFAVQLINTGLPVIYINTENGVAIASKDDYLAATVRVIKEDGEIDLSAGTEVRGRGNSTWSMPKKPYRLKLSNAASILGYPADRDWVLLANYSDKSLIRTRLAFETSSLFDLEYTPRSTPVELIVNGVYQGSYLFGEHLKVAADRVNVAPMTKSDDSGDNLSGGYFLELDQRLDADFWFKTSRDVPFTMKSPDAPTPNQYNYIKNYIQDLEDVLFSQKMSDPDSGYARFIDVESFIQWYWMMELFKNNDAIQWSSVFYYKDRNAKLKMGPVWDFDISAGNIDFNDNANPADFYVRRGSWFTRFFQDPAFLRKANAYWNSHRDELQNFMMLKVDEYAADVSISQQQNFRKWDILNTYVWPNAVVTGSYQAEIDYLKTWLQARIEWINNQISTEKPGKIVPKIAWASPNAIKTGTPLSELQLNAVSAINELSVAGRFVYTPVAGTMLPVGDGQTLEVTFFPADTTVYETVTKTTIITVRDVVPQFFRAVNLNGPALQIDGNDWQAASEATSFSFSGASAFEDQNAILLPETDANRAAMVLSSLWGNNITLSIGSIPAATYQIYLYVWEDNSPTTFTIRLEDVIVEEAYNTIGRGRWSRLGPYSIDVLDGSLTVSATGGDVNFSGVEIWTIGDGSPLLAIPLVDQRTTVGSMFSYSFPRSTFSGVDLKYTLTSGDGVVLPGWLSFHSDTLTFAGTPDTAGTSIIRVTASNEYGSASDEFTVRVGELRDYTLYKAINIHGPSLQIDDQIWEAGASNAAFSASNATAFSSPDVPLIPSADPERSSMIRSSFRGTDIGLSLESIKVGNYLIYLHVWEDDSPEVYAIRIEDQLVKDRYYSGTAGTWSRLGPFEVAVEDGTLNINASGGAANFSGLEVWQEGSDQDPGRDVTSVAPTSDHSTGEGSTKLTVFPNPFSDLVNVHFIPEQTGITDICLLDTRGVQLYHASVTGSANEDQLVSIRSASIPSGVYLIRLTDATRVRFVKVMLLR